MRLADATILIADDEAELLAIFRKWFEREGCRVLVACNGADALELAERNHVDLIISDTRMPVVDGIEMVGRVTASLSHRVRVILVSGFSEIDLRELYDLGVEALLGKPMRRGDLVEAAQRCLTDKQERWRDTPVVAPGNAIAMKFDSLHEAVQRGLIAFGCGGFCMPFEFGLGVDRPVGLSIEFHQDGQTLAGEGVVRWTDAKRGLIGVEIMHVADANRDWVIGLTGHDAVRPFIPRTCLPE